MRTEEISVPGRSPICLHDYKLSSDTFLEDVLHGLTQTTKTLPSKYFYDERGSALFEKITELPVYYLTRAELAILERYGAEVGQRVGERCLLVEYGAGNSLKACLVLNSLEVPAGYVPVDISRDHLLQTAREVAGNHPELPVHAVYADYMNGFDIPSVSARAVMVYFSGSTIGNLHPDEAAFFLGGIVEQVGEGGYLLIGVDLKKDVETLEAAYNDPEGITAAFNKNMLVRINRELGGDFDLEAFTHRAVYNQALGRIEMHLVSRMRQDVRIGGQTIPFQDGETIHTENSYKYDTEEFEALAEEGGFEVEKVWMDDDDRFSVQLLRVA